MITSNASRRWPGPRAVEGCASDSVGGDRRTAAAARPLACPRCSRCASPLPHRMVPHGKSPGTHPHQREERDAHQPRLSAGERLSRRGGCWVLGSVIEAHHIKRSSPGLPPGFEHPSPPPPARRGADHVARCPCVFGYRPQYQQPVGSQVLPTKSAFLDLASANTHYHTQIDSRSPRTSCSPAPRPSLRESRSYYRSRTRGVSRRNARAIQCPLEVWWVTSML